MCLVLEILRTLKTTAKERVSKALEVVYLQSIVTKTYLKISEQKSCSLKRMLLDVALNPILIILNLFRLERHGVQTILHYIQLLSYMK